MEGQKCFKCIACDVLFREYSLAATESSNIIKLAFMRQGLHSAGAEAMSKALQEEIDNTDIDTYDAILLGYGLCSYGVRGLHSQLPLVIPRAHDCITLLMGDRDKYMDYFGKNPGTFYLSAGWLERTRLERSINEADRLPGSRYTREEMIERYGEEMADYIAETLGSWNKNYSKYTFIDTGTGPLELYEKEAKSRAAEKDWEYEKYIGDNRLVQLMFAGEWNDYDFLVVPPGKKIKPSYDDGIIGFE